MRFTLRGLFISVAVLAAVIGLLNGAYTVINKVETGEHMSSVDWLPATASNVSFYKSYSRKTFEFDISEDDFIAWSSWDLQPVTTPISILRYNFHISDPIELGLDPSDRNVLANVELSHQARILNGLYYAHRQSNGGGIQVAYDRDKGRAYYFSSPH